MDRYRLVRATLSHNTTRLNGYFICEIRARLYTVRSNCTHSQLGSIVFFRFNKSPAAPSLPPRCLYQSVIRHRRIYASLSRAASLGFRYHVTWH